MHTRRMANQEIKSLAQILGTWLKESRGREKIEFFDMEQDTWEKLVPPLQALFPDTEINQDVETLKMVLNDWTTRVAASNDATKLEVDQAAKTVPDGLTFNPGARKLWYNKMKGQNDEEWTDAEPALAKWTDILTSIVDMALDELNVVETRWTQARDVQTTYRQFDQLAKTYGSKAMSLKITSRQVTREQAIESIQNANVKADEWLQKLNQYYDFQPNNAQKEGMMLFFPSPDGLNRTDIRWNDFVEMLATKKSRVAAFVMNYGGTAKTIDDFPEQAA